MDASQVSVIAAVVSAIAAAASAFFAWRTSGYARSAAQQNSTSQLRLLKETLRVAKNILENTPKIGFDYTPKPDFNIDRITKALGTKDLLDPEAMNAVRLARHALLAVDSIIGETKTDLPTLTVNFRKRFPVIKDEALSAINQSLKVLPDNS